ncbi:MAG: phosphatase PAP2 family protein [Planctomycetes bacterium]|nr:phosphatase PAP2 family protein [Planctomycetota bacterium]
MFSGDPNEDAESLDPVDEIALRLHWTVVNRTHLLLYIVLPVIALVFLTTCVRCFDLDLRISRLFFNAEASRFPELDARQWLVLYRYGPIPGLIMGISATAMFVASFAWHRLRAFREPCALVALLLALGPGLLVNGLLKPSWDRPRPCELTEFGGSEDFVPVLNLREASEHRSKSFPSGHASMGFYLLAPIFIRTRSSRRWSLTFLVIGLSLGIAMGVGRVAQGSHFASDVLWSGAIVYFTGLVLAYVLPPASQEISTEASNDRDLAAEPSVFRLDEYRESVDRENNTPETRIRDAPKRRAA